jgi:hypothetical protein
MPKNSSEEDQYGEGNAIKIALLMILSGNSSQVGGIP